MRDPTRLRNRHAVAGIGLSRFGKVPGVSAMGFCLEAAKRAIDDCGITRDDIDGVLCLMPAQMGEQHGWASRVAAFLGITPAFCATMDMGGATAVGMMQTAVMAIEAGFCEVVLCTFGTQTNPQGIVPQLFGRAGPEDPSVINDISSVCHPQSLAHVMICDQYPNGALLQPDDNFLDVQDS